VRRQLRCPARVPLAQRLKSFELLSKQRRREQFFQSIGDSAERRVDDQDARAAVQPRTRSGRNIAPVGFGGDAGTAELQNDPTHP